MVIVDVLIGVPIDIRKRATWAIDTLMNAGGIGWREIDDTEKEHSTILLQYGSGELSKSALRAKVILNVPCDPGFYRVDRDSSLLQNIRKIVAGAERELVSVEKGGETVICQFRGDLFGHLFFHLSRVEEKLLAKPGAGGRFYAEQSLLQQADLLHVPVADEMIDRFVETLIEASCIAGIPLLRKARWPDGERMAIFLSHDVDRLRKWTPGRIIRETARGIRRIVEVGKAIASGNDPYQEGFEEIVGMETPYGIRSTFYVGGRSSTMTVTERWDLSYSLHKECALVRFLSQIATGGWEVGLHGSLISSLSVERLYGERMELERCIGTTVAGVRQHYLRCSVPETWQYQEAAGFLYDTTLGYADAEGFRAGTSLPFRPYDVYEEQPLTLIEIPLVVMDVTLDGYRHYDAHTAEEKVFSLFSTVEKHRGVFSFLLHQNALDAGEHPFTRDIYRQILTHTSSEGVYRITGREVARWWRQRTGMKIQNVHQERGVWKWVCQSSTDIERMTLEVSGIQTLQSFSITGCDGRVYRKKDGSVTVHLSNVPEQRPVEIVVKL